MGPGWSEQSGEMPRPEFITLHGWVMMWHATVRSSHKLLREQKIKGDIRVDLLVVQIGLEIGALGEGTLESLYDAQAR